MPFADGQFVRATSRPRVYRIESGARRWIPDPTTLLALAQNGWADVLVAPDAEVDAVPEGTPLPSRTDGLLYRVIQKTEVFLMRDLHLHHVPDDDTLAALGGGGAVVPLEQADFDDIPVSTDVPSIHAVDGQHALIDAWVRSLGDLPAIQERLDRMPAPATPVQFDGIDYTQVVERVHKTRAADLASVASPVLDVLYPGALVQGASIGNGQLAPIPLPRNGGTITVTTDLSGAAPVSRSADVDVVSLQTIEDARNGLLRALDPSDAAAKLTLSETQAKTLEAGFVNLGVSYKGAVLGVDVKGAFDTGLRTNTAIVSYQQVFYTMAFTPRADDHPFLDDATTLADLKNHAGPGNPPAYISQVDYGRSLFVIITGSAAWTDLTAAVKGSVEALKAGVAIDGSYQHLLQQSTIQVLAGGGATAGVVKLLTDPLAELPGYLTAGGAYSKDNPGVPLRYTTRYVGSRNVLSTPLTADYDETVDVVGQNAHRSLQIWDGPGGGPRSTDLRIAAGDSLKITATGQNWSGVFLTGTYGPDGWITWDRPSGSGYPLPDHHPFALCGTYDNNGAEWFYVGSGFSSSVSFAQPGATSRVLWLGTNDNDPFNGDDHRRFDVEVDVVRRPKDALGLVGANRSA